MKAASELRENNVQASWKQHWNYVKTTFKSHKNNKKTTFKLRQNISAAWKQRSSYMKTALWFKVESHFSDQIDPHENNIQTAWNNIETM